MEWEDVYERKEEIEKIFDEVDSDLSNVDQVNKFCRVQHIESNP